MFSCNVDHKKKLKPYLVKMHHLIINVFYSKKSAEKTPEKRRKNAEKTPKKRRKNAGKTPKKRRKNAEKTVAKITCAM